MELNLEEEENQHTIPLEAENNDLNQRNLQVEAIVDLGKLIRQSEIRNSDVILTIFEICTFNKKYNYDCSNNTKAFWERVVNEDILKKIFKNFKSETLRKYWKMMRLAGNNDKYIEIVKQNEDFINNPVFKLLPIINGITTYIQTNSDKNFEDYFTSLNSKNKPPSPKNDSEKKYERAKGLKVKKVEVKEESEKEEVDPKILKLDDLINQLMKITKFSREEVFRALYGTSGNIKHAYLYLMDNIKYDKYYFLDTDDYIIKNLRTKNYFKELMDKKGEELIKEREIFLGIK